MAIYHTQQEAKVYNLIAQALEFMQYEIVRIRLKQGEKPVLQIMIDRLDEAPLSIQDCESVSRQVSVMLDVDDVVSGHYVLEVSSPGLERPLTRNKDFSQHIGEMVKISTFTPIAGGRRFAGMLLASNDESVSLRPSDKGEDMNIRMDNIREALLQPFMKNVSRSSQKKKNKHNLN